MAAAGKEEEGEALLRAELESASQGSASAGSKDVRKPSAAGDVH